MVIQPKHLLVSNHNQLVGIYSSKKIKDLQISITKYQLGNIYIGKIESILPNIEAAFIKLDKYEKNGFIHLNQLSPKKWKIKKERQNAIPNLGLNKKVLVQVVKEPTASKGPSLCTNVGLLGEYIILLPFDLGVNISKKILDSKEKYYIKAFISLLKPSSMGVLIKKEAIKATDLEIKRDLLILKEKWGILRSKIKDCIHISLLSSKTHFIKKVISGFYDSNIIKISTDSMLSAWDIYSRVILLKQKFISPRPLIIEYHKSYSSLAKYFCLDFTIHTMLQPRVNLATGGYIVIEKTEALTAIDINSGSFNHLVNSRATILWLNCEAATEIAKQLSLRNIGGIIVIDFIDMSFQKDQITVLNHLNNILKKDKSPARIIQLSEIGLVELTRRRQGQNIYDIFGYKCDKCDGIGYSTDFSIMNKNSFKPETFCNYSK